MQKKGLDIFTYNTIGRKTDRDNLFKHRELLRSVLLQTHSEVIDKQIILDGLQMFNENTGGMLKYCISSVATQAYAIKQYFMAIGQAKRNSTTKARLAPWLQDLVNLCILVPDEVAIETPAPPKKNLKIQTIRQQRDAF